MRAVRSFWSKPFYPGNGRRCGIPCTTPVPMPDRHNRRIGIIAVENLRQAVAGDRPAQQVLAGPGVLAGEEPAIDQQPRVIIDDEEQPGPDRALPPEPGHPRPDEHIGDPPLVRPAGLITAVGFRLGGELLAVQPGAAGRGWSAQRPARRAGGTRSRRSARPTVPAAPAAARPPRRTAPGGRVPPRCRPAARDAEPPAPRLATPAASGRSCPWSNAGTSRPGGRGQYTQLRGRQSAALAAAARAARRPAAALGGPPDAVAPGPCSGVAAMRHLGFPRTAGEK